MQNEFSRAELLLGKDALERLKTARVAVFGLGGVGSFAAEAIARCGVGAMDLIDDDSVCLTNINRQLIATHKTIGRKKAEVMKERVLDINPKCEARAYECFYTAENADEIPISDFDYIVDAIDTISSKLTLIEKAKEAGVPIISCMGAGNKLDPTAFEVEDIFKTSVCPLARVMRKELKARGITSLKVVYSKEAPLKPEETEGKTCKDGCVCPPGSTRNCAVRRQIPGSVSFVPPVAGLILASEVIKDLAAMSNDNCTCEDKSTI